MTSTCIYRHTTFRANDADISIDDIAEVLESPANYQIAIKSFSVPMTGIPRAIVPCNDVGLLDASVGLSYHGEIFIAYPSCPRSSSVTSHGKGYQTQFGSIQEFLIAINTAYVAVTKRIGSLRPPVFSYDPIYELFSFTVGKMFLVADSGASMDEKGDAPGPPRILMSEELYTYFSGFASEPFETDGVTYRSLIVFDNQQSGGKNISVMQESSSLAQWSVVNEIDVHLKYMPATSSDSKDIDAYNQIAFTRERIRATVGYHLYYSTLSPIFFDISAQLPLASIQIHLLWLDRYEAEHKFRLSSAHHINLIFRKKSNLMANYWGGNLASTELIPAKPPENDITIESSVSTPPVIAQPMPVPSAHIAPSPITALLSQPICETDSKKEITNGGIWSYFSRP